MLDVFGALAVPYLVVFWEARRVRRENQVRSDRNAHAALVDCVTNLPSRLLFADRVSHEVRHARRADVKVAVVLVELDRFALVDERFGTAAGDRILDEVGRRLRSSLRASDTIARARPDAFGLVLPTADREDAQRVVHRLFAAIEQSIPLDSGELRVRAGGGIAVYPDDADEFEALLRVASVDLSRHGLGQREVSRPSVGPDSVRHDARSSGSGASRPRTNGSPG